MFSCINKKLSTALAVTVIFCCTAARAQNINTPNKRGPLGTQVNTLSGNLLIPRMDMHVPARGLDISMSFYYNSYFFDQNFGFGKGWTSIYSMSYKNDTANGKIIFWGDGREDAYKAAGAAYTAPTGVFNRLTQYQPGKFLLTQPDGIKYLFDNSIHRRITRIEDPNGNFLSFTYSDSLLTGITNGAGQAISMAYNAAGNLSTVTEANTSPAKIFSYTYDNAGLLKQVTDPAGGIIKYDYLINGPMKSVSDKNSNIIDIIYYADYSVSELISCNSRQSYSYDTTIHVTTATDYLSNGNQVTKYGYEIFGSLAWLSALTSNCCGYNMTFEFDAQGNKIKQTDANGNITQWTYDDRGNMLTRKDALNQTISYTYTPDLNRVASFTDAKGNTTTLAYNAAGNLTQMVLPGNEVYTTTYNAAGDLLTSVDPKGNTFTYNYDAYGYPATVTGPGNYRATLSYDARGNLLAYTDARGNTGSLQYDILGRLKKVVDPFNNSFGISYDAAGNPTTFTDQDDAAITMKYDAGNRITEFKDVLKHKSFISYDGVDNITAITNAAGNTSSFSYDSRNRLNGFTDALSNSNSVSYDANGNIVSITLANGETMNYTYDAVNRVTAMSDINGAVGAFAYDANDNLVSFTNGTGAVTTYTYDNLNHVKQIDDALGNSVKLTFDQNNNVASLTDRNGKVQTYIYDSLNRIKAFTDKNGSVLSITYDAEGNKSTLKDQDNNITAYTYDSLNRVKTMTYPDGKFIQYGYDKRGNLVSKKIADGSTVNFVYDSLSRIISKSLPDGQTFTYTYDSISRVRTATNNAGTVVLTYDALDRLASETFDGRTTRYDYNTAGRTQTLTYPDGTVIIKTFDTRNNLVSISKNNSVLVTYQYNNKNQLIHKTFANGVSTFKQYDFANRLSNYTTGGGSIQNTNLGYDNERQKTSLNRLSDQIKSEQFIYDNNMRLTGYKKGVIGGTPVLQHTYTYDALGNRTAANLNGTNFTYNVNNLNQLTGSNNGSTNINFTYDNNGNLTYDGIFHKKYDPEGRLVRDSSAPGNVWAYLYDAFGRRVQKTYNGIPLKYSYAGFSQIEERDGITNAVNSKTVFENFLTPVVNEKNGSSFFYHQDDRNSVEAISNAQGRLIEKYEYDPYGSPSRYDSAGNTLTASLAGNRFGFTGQEYDSADGSYNFHFRNYSPATGTFNQRDLLGYADGTGMYQYVHNNPANGIDLLGLAGNPCPDNPSEDVPQDLLDGYNNIMFLLSQLGDAQKAGKIASQQDMAKLLLSLAKYAGQVGEHGAVSAEFLAKNSSLVSKCTETLKSFNESGAFKGAAIAGNAIDLLYKVDKLSKIDANPNSSQNQYLEARSDAAIAAVALAESFGPTQGKITGIYNLVDFGINKVTGYGSITHQASTAGYYYGAWYYSWYYGVDIPEFDNPNDIPGSHRPGGPCPQNKNPRGTQKPPPGRKTPNGGSTEIVQSGDPNLIIGPDGVPSKAWVSVKDRLPYTILYENSKAASAPAKFVRITSPIEPKEDANTFQLGTFGFNNQTFSVPNNAASYYQRLDARDSLGLFVDVTAGYDQIGGQAFWEFQSIDPVTLLPPSDPLKGFLLLQDSSKGNNGHAFVNFSIKPKQTAVTLDTIGARASIVFDQNDTIPTNIAKNTIDAFAPTSHMNTLPSTSYNPVALSWGGTDDPGGCGVWYYTLYVSTDGVNYNIVRSNITRTDTTFTGTPNTSYSFFVLATDSVGNTEVLRTGEVRSTFIGAVVPVTWLHFSGITIGKDNLLNWSTATEQNSREFKIERSLDANTFTAIGTKAAAGNSATVRDYTYTDKNIDLLKAPVMYYRIKQIDLNGNSRYSNIVRLTYDQKGTAPSIVYPNPTQGLITVTIGDPALIGTEGILFDANGKLLEKIKISGNSFTVDLGKYTYGTYYIRLANKETMKVVRL